MNEEPKKDPYAGFRDEKGRLLPGLKSIGGRPPGKTMKEWARDFLLKMTEDEKAIFMDSLEPEVLWRMAEGNPHQTQDVTSGGEPIIPIYGGVSKHDSDKKDIPAPEENKGG